MKVASVLEKSLSQFFGFLRDLTIGPFETWKKQSKFENFNLVVKTEMLRRATNYLSYFIIFLFGLEMLLSFSRNMNINRILIYSFGVCLIYNFVESLVADSISVFGLPFYLQGFPILLVIVYFSIRKRLFF